MPGTLSPIQLRLCPVADTADIGGVQGVAVQSVIGHTFVLFSFFRSVLVDDVSDVCNSSVRKVIVAAIHHHRIIICRTHRKSFSLNCRQKFFFVQPPMPYAACCAGTKYLLASSFTVCRQPRRQGDEGVQRLFAPPPMTFSFDTARETLLPVQYP